MTDRFFTQKTCDRCHKPLNGIRTMSRFNTDCICKECERKEQLCGDYQQAADAEREAVNRGDLNFPGIGLSKNDTKGEE